MKAAGTTWWVAGSLALLALAGCGGSRSHERPGATSSTMPPSPPTAVAPKAPRQGREVVYTPERPRVSSACKLVHLGKRMGGPTGAHWLIQPPPPNVRATRAGRRVTVSWSFTSVPKDCRPAWIEFTLRSPDRGKSTYYAGGTQAPIKVTGKHGRYTFRAVWTPKGAPYALLANARTSDNRVRGPITRIRLG
jgi:hypothetical protein